MAWAHDEPRQTAKRRRREIVQRRRGQTRISGIIPHNFQAICFALNRIEQVDYHLKKAFENGLTKEELVAAITHIAFYAGWPTAASGFSHLKKVIGQQ